VRRYIDAKRASMQAHASQATADGGADRTLAAFLRMPRPLYRRVFGTEWYRRRP
jgi:LmbE family N-acetylglucosaminyl deacetylase